MRTVLTLPLMVLLSRMLTSTCQQRFTQLALEGTKIELAYTVTSPSVMITKHVSCWDTFSVHLRLDRLN